MIQQLKQLLGFPTSTISAKVELYSWQTCPYCIRAKLLLWWKGVDFIDYKIDGDNSAREKMSQRSNGRRTVSHTFLVCVRPDI